MQFSCGLKSEDQALLIGQNIAEIEELKSIITKNSLPDLILEIEEDQRKTYLLANENAVEQVSKIWNTDPNKLSISAYVKPKDLTGIIRAYNCTNSEIVRTNNIPKIILNSFNSDFKCPKPDKNSPIKRSTTLAFEKQDATLRKSIEEFK